MTQRIKLFETGKISKLGESAARRFTESQADVDTLASKVTLALQNIYGAKADQKIPAKDFKVKDLAQEIAKHVVGAGGTSVADSNQPEKIVAKNAADLKRIVIEEIKRHGKNVDLNHIDTSNVDSFSMLFKGIEFNGDVSKWNTSNVRSLYLTFAESKFNGDVSKWDTSKVTDMERTFWDSPFNGDVSRWNTSRVENMSRMFGATKFNGDVSRWDVSHVKSMSFMFNETPFNGDLSKWNTSSLEYATWMFKGSKFNGNISRWNVNKLKSSNDMFADSPFDKDISKWNIDGEANKKLANGSLLLKHREKLPKSLQ